MKLSFVILSLLVLHLAAQSYDAVFAISWPAGHCEYLANRNRSCDPRISAQWDRRSFTIHGFWPGPRSSQSFGNFNRKAISSLEYNLKTSWPPRAEKAKGSKPTFNEAYFLWIHQWEKHGKDFANQALRLLGSSAFSSNVQARNLALQNRYFRDTLYLFRTIKATKLSRNPTTKRELADLLRIPESSFSTRCLPSGNLQELQICVSVFKFKKILRYKVVPCKRLKSNCPGPAVRLHDFR